MEQKRFYYKIYKRSATLWDQAVWDVDRWNYSLGFQATLGITGVDTIWSEEVINEPEFRTTIGSGPGEIKIELNREFNDFGEDEDIKLGNKVELWVFDNDSPDGVRMFTGTITNYRPVLRTDREFVEVNVLGWGWEFERFILRDSSGNTTLAYNSEDPSDILRDVIDKYRADGGNVNYTGDTISDTGTTVSYTFSLNTIKEVVDKIMELAPDGWYSWIDGDGNINFKQSSLSSADHKVAVGREVLELDANKTLERLVNRVYGVGGIPAGDIQLYKSYTRQNSIDTYGLSADKIIDGRVTVDGTMDTMADRMLDRFDSPITRARITIIDNNEGAKGDEGIGADIENFQLGDTIQIINLNFGSTTVTRWDVSTWDSDVWDNPLSTSIAEIMEITNIDYRLDRIILEASDRLPEISKRIEDIRRNLEQEQTKDIPTVPA